MKQGGTAKQFRPWQLITAGDFLVPGTKKELILWKTTNKNL